jgi:hypothetical protein
LVFAELMSSNAGAQRRASRSEARPTGAPC